MDRSGSSRLTKVLTEEVDSTRSQITMDADLEDDLEIDSLGVVGCSWPWRMR